MASRELLALVVSGLFKKMFKKKVKSKKKKEPEDEEEEDDEEGPSGPPKKEGFTKKELEDWARLQRMLKETEGRAKPQTVESAPERERGEGPERKAPKEFGEAKQGYNYLFEELRPLNAYRVFFNFMENGDQGFLISSTYPKKIRDQNKDIYADVEKLPIYWLSDWYGASQEFLNIGAEERTLRPSRIDFEIMKELSNFIKKNRTKGVLLIDGIESLVLANSFEKVISFLTTINNMASANACTVLAPINPGVFKKRDRYILHKIFDEVRTYVDDEMFEDEE